MYIPDFTFHKPGSVTEACEILNASPNGAPIAGGTDLLVEIKQGLRKFTDIVSLNAIKKLKKISDNDDTVIIGAGVTHNELTESPIILTHFPALAKAATTIGTHQIRNTGTIGGNLCTCASCADTAPILMASDAVLEIKSISGVRFLNLIEFMVFHHETSLKKGEILTKIIIPKPRPNTGSDFNKFGLRSSASISVASVAVNITAENDIISDAHIVIGAASPVPKICPNSERSLINTDINSLLNDGDKLLDKIGEITASEATPIDDIRGSAEYRRDIIKTITKRTILGAVKNIGHSK